MWSPNDDCLFCIFDVQKQSIVKRKWNTCCHNWQNDGLSFFMMRSLKSGIKSRPWAKDLVGRRNSTKRMEEKSHFAVNLSVLAFWNKNGKQTTHTTYHCAPVGPPTPRQSRTTRNPNQIHWWDQPPVHPTAELEPADHKPNVNWCDIEKKKKWHFRKMGKSFESFSFWLQNCQNTPLHSLLHS